MKRVSILFLSFASAAGLCLFLGCNAPSTAPTGGPTATPSPTVTSTPTYCAPVTHVAIPSYFDPNAFATPSTTPYYVLRNTSDWVAYVGTATPGPTPPVDLGVSMIAAFSERSGESCTDTVTITGTCFYPDHIEVHYDFRSRYKDAQCRDLSCEEVLLGLSTTDAVALPQSALPVSWVQKNLCP